ncbi:MAG TPA: polysaccharide biosynthesis protein [Tissierellaceae bacterium]
MKEKGFMKGAAILGFAGVIVKILGAVYRIPVGNIITDEGMGYYQTAYPFYMLMLTVSTVGFPVAIAKLVSEKRALKDYKNAHKVFQVALLGLFIISLITSVFVFLNAEKMVNYLENPNAYYSLIALVPALFFVPIMSAFRGYFQGMQNMVPTALSQVAEQFFRVFFGLILTYYLVKNNASIAVAAGGVSFGGSIGALMGTVVIYFVYLKNKKTINLEVLSTENSVEYKTTQVIKDLLVIAIPITIGSAITPIMDAIDTKLVMSRLQTIGYSELEANALFGQLKGFAQTLINLPQVFSIAIGMSLVPVISEYIAKKDKENMEKTISAGIRMTLLVGLPSAVGLFVLAKPLIGLLYFNNTLETIESTGMILRYLSIGVIFLTLVQTSTSIIQGLGKPMIPVLTLLVGATLKVFLTYYLTAIPSININGAAISTVCAYLISAVLNIIIIVRKFDIKFSYKDIIIKPTISAVTMGIIVSVSFNLIKNIIGDSKASLVAVLIGGISYVVLLVVTKTITKEDILLLPKGEKIVKILNRKGGLDE